MRRLILVAVAWCFTALAQLPMEREQGIFGRYYVTKNNSAEKSLHLEAVTGLYQSYDGTSSATSNNDPVGYWRDVSGDSRNVIQATAGNRPLLQTTLPSVKFDGTDDRLAYVGNLAADTTGTLLIAFRTGATAIATRGTQVLFSSANSAAADYWFEVGITSLGKIYVESNISGTKHTVEGSAFLENSTNYVLAVAYDGVDYYSSLNGIEQNPLVITTGSGAFTWFDDVPSADNLVLGGTVTSAGLVRPFEGEVLEIIVYAEDIT